MADSTKKKVADSPKKWLILQNQQEELATSKLPLLSSIIEN
jgi:hypothetical protein